MAGICLLSVLLFIMQMPSSSSDQKIIPAESGQKSISLPCRAPNSNIRVVEWSRADLGEKYVFVYRDGQFVPDDQHPSFKNRVDLQDRQMKDGDVSLILKDVTTADSGMYKCRVLMEETGSWEHSSIYLNVDPPGQTGGHTEEGVSRGRFGMIAVLVFVIVVFVAAFLLIYRRCKQQSEDSHCHPAEVQIEMSKSFLNSGSTADEHRDRSDSKANNCHQHSTRIPDVTDVTLTHENELVCPPPSQETAGLLEERDIRVQ